MHRAPEVILRNEKRMLQEAVDALFDNGRRSRPFVAAARLSDMLGIGGCEPAARVIRRPGSRVASLGPALLS